MKNKLAAWIALGLIAIIAAACLAVTNEVTKDVIEAQNVAAMQSAWATLVPGAEFPEGVTAAESEEGVPKEYVYAGVVDGEPVGYVAQTAVQGYGGEIEVIVGTDTDGIISGISVGGANFSETAGLGAKSKEPAFTDQFKGKTAPLSVGENIDAITASTITSNAVVRAVNTAMEAIAPVAGFTIDMPAAEAGAVGEGRYAASTKGFAGPVYVEIQLNDANEITEIVIGDDQFAETAGYGQKALEPAFYEQFIGKTGQLELGADIDAIGGATVTSKAVVDAVNTAMLYATDPEAAAAAAAGAGSFELPEVPDNALTETASRKGFAGPVAATITIDPETHELLRVEFGDDQWAETDGLGSRIHDDDFWQQFIGKTLPIEDGEIDLIAGATITSQAAFEAVNKAYGKLFPSEGGEAAATTEGAAQQDPNNATASSKGFAGPVAAAITVDDAGVLTAVTFGDDKWAETDGLGSKIKEDDFVNQFIGKTLPLADGDIDTIAGATVTSEAAIAAVNKAFGKIEEARASGAAPAVAVSDTDKAASASSKGFAGPVAAAITVGEDNVLTSVAFGDDKWAETDGLGSKIKEDDFVNQFIGKALPLAEGDIDTIAGATVTSEAAIAAVNKAFDKLAEAGGEETAAPAGETAAAGNTATASSKGFAGPVAATIEVDESGALTSVTFGDDNWAETDGLGSKIKEDDFVNQFIGKTLPLAEGDIDTIAGATVTSEAAIAAVNKAFDKLAEAGSEETAAPAGETAAAGNTATASSKGFAGPVAATIEVDESGALTSVTFGDDKWAETDGLGSKIKEDDFVNQFIGKALPLAEGDIDTIAGATVTSEAAIAAVNKAFDKLAEAGAEKTAAPVEAAADASGRVASSAAMGINGPIAVEITVDDANTITGIVFGDKDFAETEGRGSKVLEDDFAAQFIGKTLPLAEGDIDVIAGATISSEAAVKAVNKAFAKLAPAAEETAAPEAEVKTETADLNTATASAKGFGGPVAVTLTVDADYAITEIAFGDDNWAETDGLGSKIKEDDFTNQFIGKTLPLAEGDIDAISGSTVTCEAALAAVEKAYGKILDARCAEEGTAGGENRASEASSKGYGGPIWVRIEVAADNVLTQIEIGNDAFAETQGLGTKVLDADFAAQFIGKSLPLGDGDIDAIAAATVSSEAVVSAVNKAFDKLQAQ